MALWEKEIGGETGGVELGRNCGWDIMYERRINT